MTTKPGTNLNVQVYPTIKMASKDANRVSAWTEYVYNDGMTLLDYFAGQYMANGHEPQEAFRLASLALQERSRYTK